MSTLFICIASLFIAAIPAFLTYRKARRERQLSDAQLRITQAITALERDMLEGRFTRGDACHDLLFKLMLRVQYQRVYPVDWNPLAEEDPRLKEAKMRIAAELKTAQQESIAAISAFVAAYYDAFRAKHPIASLLFALRIGLQLIYLKGVLFALKAILKGRRIRKDLQTQYTARAGAIILGAH